MRPTAPDVAHAANCSIRSVFQHFPALNELYRAALADQRLAERIVGQVAARVTVYDQACAIVCGEIGAHQ